MTTGKKGKVKAFITPDGRTMLPDGEELIQRKKAAEILEVSANTMTRMIRDGKISDLMPEHGTKLVRLTDVEKLKAVRDGALGEGGETAEEQLISAQRARQHVNLQKYRGILTRTAAKYVTAIDAAAACEALGDIVASLSGWEPEFGSVLDRAARKVFDSEVSRIVDEAQRSLAGLSPAVDPLEADAAQKSLTVGDGELDTSTVTIIRAQLEMAKAQLVSIEVAEGTGGVVQRGHLKQELRDIATTARMQIENIRLLLIPHVRRDDRLELRPAITAKLQELFQAGEDSLPEGPAREAWALGFTPPEDLTVSEWADEYRVLGSGSAEPGRFRTDRTPYMREIADAIGDDACRRVSLRLCAQSGKSELILSVIGQSIDQNPGPTMMLQPTIDAAASFMAERVQPMLEGTPRLADKLKHDDESGKGAVKKTALIKEFVGGYLVAVGGSSSSGLASRAIRTLLMDEIDRLPPSASGGEGSPRLLAERRTQSFLHTRKIVAVSTPTVKGESEIDKLYEQGTQEQFFAKCPHCGESAVMTFDNLKWEAGKPETAAYISPCCGTVWSDADRHAATLSGGWIANNPAALPEHRSFHADALVSPFHTHESMAKEIENAVGDAMAERTLTNTMRAESYTDETALLTDEAITNRIEAFDLDSVPEAVLALTVGIDVQRDRLELLFVGFTEDGVALILSHLIIAGSPFDAETWEAATEALDRPILHPYGGQLPIDMVAIDSGYATKEVVTWAAQRTNRYAIKGVPGVDKPRWALSKGTKGHAAEIGESLHLVGTFQGKESALLSLQKPVGDKGSVRIGSGVESFIDRDAFARQLNSEYRRQTPQKNGVIKVEWIKKAGRRSEILDCFVYADSAFSGSLKPRVNWEKRRSRMGERPAPQREADASQESAWVTMPTGSTGATSTSTPASTSGYDPNAWGSFG